MDVPEIGAKCAAHMCVNFEYMPFKCEACGLMFCAEHRMFELHECSKAMCGGDPGGEFAGVSVSGVVESTPGLTVSCPLCAETLFVKKNGGENSGTVSTDELIAKHISAGCPKRARKNKMCSADGCRKREVVKMICRVCNKNFCLEHRHEADHNCTTNPAIKNTTPALKSNVGIPTKLSERLARITQTSKNQLNEKEAVGRHGFANSEAFPEGDESIEPADRFVLAVYFPLSDSQPPRYMYFHRRNTVGRVLDLLHDRLPREVANSSSRLNLFVVRASGVSALPHIERLIDFPSSVLRQGDCVVIESAPSLSPLWLQRVPQARKPIESSAS
uniref:AN1-type domain-containing protein n=1 Tax=Erythrolobus madagascarensis TaxID=708628 RepID=A0A7S0T789_9RHOD